MRLLRAILVVLAAVLASVVFFRVPVLSGFDRLPCDNLDGNLIFGIVDHWRLVFSGARAWRDLGMFWPVTDTLGYSDTFFLHGGIHAALCALGMDSYHAFTATFMLLAGCGFILMYLFLRRVLSLPVLLALVVSFLFVNLAPVQASGTHLQLMTVWLLPGTLLLGWEALRGGCLAWLWAGAAGVFLGLLFFTTFYVPWFFVFFMCIAALVKILLLRASRSWREVVYTVWRAFCDHRRAVLAFALAFAVTLVPFLAVYLPPLSSGGAWSYKGMFRALPSLVDYVNVGGFNSFWGAFFGGSLDARDYGCELLFGLPFFTMAAFLVACVFFWRRRGRLGAGGDFLYVVAISVLVSWGLLLRVGDFSLWWLVRTFVPGAGVIRAAFRFNVVLSFFALIVIAGWLGGISAAGRRLAVAGGLVFSALLVCEQLARVDSGSLMSRAEEIRFMESIPQPPEGVRQFFAISRELPNVQAQVMAFRVAQKFNLHTVNGFSGSAPQGYFPADIHANGYEAAVNGWLNFKYHSFWVLDLDKHSWPIAMLPLNGVYTMGTDILRNHFSLFNAGGWSRPEMEGVWSSGKFAKLVLLPVGEGAESPKVLEFECDAFLPKGTPWQEAVLRVNGTYLGTARFESTGSRSFRFLLPASCNNVESLVFTFEIPKARSPESRGLWNDDRLLGVLLKSFVVRAR